MKKLLLATTGLFLIGNSFGQVVFTENFESGLPATWSQVTSATDGGWKNGTASSLSSTDWSISTSNSTKIMATNDDGCNCNKSNDRLISPVIDLSGYTNLALSTDIFFNMGTYQGNTEVGTIEISADGGTTWTILSTLSQVLEWHTDIIDISSYAGNNNVKISYKYSDATGWLFGFGIDNVKIFQPNANDAKLVSSNLIRYALINTNNTINLEVMNMGSNTINALTIDWNDGTSHSSNISVNIAPFATATVSHPISVNYATALEKNISINITQVNGGADDDVTNNTGSSKFNAVSVLEKKSVLIEEGTGTWCGWCPRGAVAMEYMYQQTATAKDFIGIAVHNGDPMTVSAYDAGANFGGYPAANVDRALLDQGVSNTAFMNYYNARKTLVPPAAISADITNDGGNNFTIVAKATFRTNFAASNYRLGVIMVEDDVTGTASGYNQANYYSSTSQNQPLSGAGHNWQQEPNPVPAANMVYDHVGRALLGGYAGQAGSVPAAITDGQVASYTFNYAKPATSNGFKMKAVVVLIDQANGEVVNAMETPIGFASIAEVENNIAMKLFPNPAVDMLNVEMNGQGAEYVLTLTDLAGKVVYHQNLGNVNGTTSVAIPVSEMQAGNYLLTIATEGRSFTENVVVTK